MVTTLNPKIGKPLNFLIKTKKSKVYPVESEFAKRINRDQADMAL